MHIKTYLLAGSLAATCLGNPLTTPAPAFCGTPKLSEEQKNEARIQLASVDVGSSLESRATINVPVYMHVIASSQTAQGGYLAVRPAPKRCSIISLTRNNSERP